MKQDADRQKMTGDALGYGRAIRNDRKSSVEHRERLLDDALAQSFPASDPPSICHAQDWPVDAGPLHTRLDKGGLPAISIIMSERSQFRRPELHPGSSTARL
jgi:hypothetical protein